MKKLLALGAMLLSCAEMSSVSALVWKCDDCVSTNVRDTSDCIRVINFRLLKNIENCEQYNTILYDVCSSCGFFFKCLNIASRLCSSECEDKRFFEQETRLSFEEMNNAKNAYSECFESLLSLNSSDHDTVDILNKNNKSWDEMFQLAQDKFNSVKETLGIE